MTEATAKLELVYTSRGFEKADKGLKTITKDTIRADKAAAKHQKTLKAYNPVLGGLKGLFAGLGLAALAAKTFEVVTSFQDLNTALEAVVGSAELGAQAFDEIKEIAKETPFSVKAMTEAYISLRASGIEPTKDLLLTFADAASVTTEKLDVFKTLIQVTARSVGGGLQLEDLNRIFDRVPGSLQALTAELDTTRLGLTKIGETAEGSALVMEALQKILKEKFAGAAELSLKNLSVATSNLGIAFSGLIFNISETGSQTGVLVPLIEGLTEVLDLLAANADSVAVLLQGMAVGLALVAGPVAIVTVAVVALVAAFFDMDEILAGIGAAVDAIAVTFRILGSTFEYMTTVVKSYFDETINLESAEDKLLKAIHDNVDGYKSYSDRLDENRKKRKAENDESAETKKNLEDEGKALLVNGKTIAQRARLLGESTKAAKKAETDTKKLNETIRENQKVLDASLAVLNSGIKSRRELNFELDLATTLAANNIDVTTEQGKATAKLIETQNRQQRSLDEAVASWERMFDINDEVFATMGATEAALDGNIDSLTAWSIAAQGAFGKWGEGANIMAMKAEQLFNDRLPEALRAYLIEQNTILAGAKAGFIEYQQGLENIGQEVSDAVVNGFGKAEDALVDFVQTGKLGFADFAKSVIADITRIAVRQAIIRPLLGSLGLTPVAKGGFAGQQGIQSFAQGGLVAAPQTFAAGGMTGLAGENGTEAILPVVRTPSGKAGVRSMGGGESTVINIRVEGGSRGEQEDNELAQKIGKAMVAAQRNVSAGETRKQQRPGNVLNPQFSI